MREPRQLSSQAEAELDELRRIGVEVTDSDVVLINALCWEIESPSSRIELSRGKPIRCGNVWLWPRTIAACKWFDDVGCHLAGLEQIALAYCMAHGRGDIELAGRAEVKAWGRQLKCTARELIAACGAVLAQDEIDELPKSKTDKDTTIGELVAVMHSAHGGDVAMWERYVSLGYVLDMLTISAAQAQAEGGQSGASVIKQRANLALALALDKITKRGKGEQSGEEE